MKSDSQSWLQTVQTNLTYWRQKCLTLSNDQDMAVVNEDHHNLLRAIEYGLTFPQTQIDAVELALQAFPLIERCDHTDLWVNIFVEMMECEVVSSSLLEVKLLNCLGILMRQRRQLDAALRIHKRAKEVANKLNHPQSGAQSLFNLSEVKRLMGAFTEAEELGNTALILFQQSSQYTRGEAATLNTLGLIAHHNRQLDKAEQYLQDAVARWQNLSEPTELGRSLSNLAEVLRDKKQLNEALGCLQEANVVLAPTASELVKVRTQNSLGTIYYHLQDYDLAETAFRTADSEALRRSGDYYMRATLAQNLANALLMQGKLSEAETHIDRAIVLFQQIENELWLANSIEILAEIMEAQGEISTALKYYEDAIALLQTIPDAPKAKKLLQNFTARYQQLGGCLTNAP